MEINTASATISFTKGLEEESARFYEVLSRIYIENKDIFLSFTRENYENIAKVERTYYGVITDALEGCFSFTLNSEDYLLNTKVEREMSYSELLRKSVEMEERILEFYLSAAEQSKSLMTDVSRVFTSIAKKRSDRISVVRSL